MDIIENIPTSKLEELDAKLVKLAKRAAKCGAEVPAYQVTAIRYLEVKDSESLREVADLRVIGSACSIEGYDLVGVIDTSSFSENLVKVVPGAEFPEELRRSKAICDHCGKYRRRKDIVVLRSEEGEHIRLGRTCVGLYLPGGDPKWAIESAKWISEVAEAEGSEPSGRGDISENTVRVLEIAAAIIREVGFVSKSAAYENNRLVATSGLVGEYLYGIDRKGYEVFRPEILEADKALAADVAEWAAAIDDTFGLGDYGNSLRVVAGSPVAYPKYFGILVSAIKAYDRWVKDEDFQARKAAEKAAKPVSNYVGEVGKRQDFVLTCEKVISIDGFYGLTGLHIFADADGNQIKWFASESANWVEEGQQVKAKATVKSHDEYEGDAQTIIQRVKVLDILKEAA